MFHVEFSLGGYHKRILLPTGRWEPGQTDQNGSHPQQSFTESTHSWHLFQQIFLQLSYQADNISQLETRSINYSHGCLHTGLVHNAGQVIFQSTLEHDRQSSIPSMLTECPGVGPYGTSLESSNLIPNSTTDVDQCTTSDSPISRDNLTGVSEQPSRHHSSTSHMGYIWEKCHHNQLYEPATNLVLSSCRDKSSKSYNSSFRKWLHWCNQQGRNLISGPISGIANFLAELFQEGYQYTAQLMNAYHSSISTIHDMVNSYSVNQHPNISRLMKGAFNKRLALPKYTFTWHVSKFTSYIITVGDNGTMSLKLLSLKLFMYVTGHQDPMTCLTCIYIF